MHTIQVPFKDYNNKPRTMTANFNLDEREVFKLLVEFNHVLSWRDAINTNATYELSQDEVVAFYNSLEAILLAAWGVPSDDGLHFRKAGRYEFEESAMFNQIMVDFVTDPVAANKFIDEMMPKGMEELVRKATANMDEVSKDDKTPESIRAQIRELQAALPAEDAAPETAS